MTPFNRTDRDIVLEAPTDAIKVISDSALQAGITLLGGLAGSGKTLSAGAVVERIKKNNNFNSNHVFQINAFQDRQAGHCVKEKIEALIEKYEGEHLLVVFDEVQYGETLKMALELARLGNSVLGVTQCLPPISLGGVLQGAVQCISDDEKPAITIELLENLNMVGLQRSLTRHSIRNLTYREKHDLASLLEEGGMDKVCSLLNEKSMSFTNPKPSFSKTELS